MHLYVDCFVASIYLLFIFFFQAEDGIRDYKVTGVQTCALPIFCLNYYEKQSNRTDGTDHEQRQSIFAQSQPFRAPAPRTLEIGRASCREREEVRGGAGVL